MAHNPGAGTRPGRLDQLVDEAIGHGALLEEGDAVLVCVSGGPDSVALLHLLWRRAPAFRLRLGVAHLDHGLRAEAGLEAQFVAGLAASSDLPFYLEKADLEIFRRRQRVSVEEAGRRLRYEFFDTVAEANGYRRVALGHHADDQAETLLLNLLRGGGGRGLAGMPAARRGRYIRPLIRAARADIEAYLEAHGLRYVVDRTNTDEALLRNRIRHRLIPVLEREYQPRVRSLLSRTAEVLGAEERWLEGLLDPLYAQVRAPSGEGRVALAAAALAGLPLAAARRLVRRALAEARGDLRRIGFAHVEGVLELAGRRTDAGPLHLPGGTRVARRGPQLWVFRTEAHGPCGPRPGPDYEYRMSGCGLLRIEEAGAWLRLSEVPLDGLPVSAAGGGRTAWLDAEAVAFPLTVRNRRRGDRFQPLGAGGTQKLKKFFSDHKVPAHERQRCPLLVSRGRILWVAGHRLDEGARVGPGATRAVKAELLVA
jgi:tRNA(Ile)-lysidine synthase